MILLPLPDDAGKACVTASSRRLGEPGSSLRSFLFVTTAIPVIMAGFLAMQLGYAWLGIWLVLLGLWFLPGAYDCPDDRQPVRLARLPIP